MFSSLIKLTVTLLIAYPFMMVTPAHANKTSWCQFVVDTVKQSRLTITPDIEMVPALLFRGPNFTSSQEAMSDIRNQVGSVPFNEVEIFYDHRNKVGLLLSPQGGFHKELKNILSNATRLMDDPGIEWVAGAVYFPNTPEMRPLASSVEGSSSIPGYEIIEKFFNLTFEIP